MEYPTDITFLVAQLEACPETGRQHVQVYIELASNKRLSGLQKIFGKQLHLEISKGSSADNIAYCTKEESRVPEEDGGFSVYYGEPRGDQGQRNDLVAFARLVQSGATDMEILDQDPRNFVLHGRAIREIRLAMASKRKSKPMVKLYWGPTGTGECKSSNYFVRCLTTSTGKSLRAHTEMPDAFTKSPGKWWDGYKSGECVIFDDFDPKDFNIVYMLQLLDVYPIQVEVSVCYL